ncbi:MAG: lipoate--protein ligase family protein [Candidatus Saccharicenans sp.]|jgi:lipoate-protein ligase A|nr:lipoate--protein ligase family protein [Candidatus Saccharicenans sp.]MDH7492672.1 biotin/lipoate A/B protein ligase family protein [Candidatus Saccharicenans sp.]
MTEVKKKIRIIDLGEVPAVRSQTCYHAVGYAFGPETPDTIILVSPATPYVCVGFHQEVEREVDLDYCRQVSLPVYRREVGGGAVYLDRHQLFVQWIFHPENLPARLEEKFRFYVEPIIQTYKEMGIEASFRPVNDIHVAGKKIGGTGAAQIGQAEILVGSFMFDFDKKTMSRVLRVSSEKMRDKVFQSLEQYLITMKELLPQIPSREKVMEIYLEKVREITGREVEPAEMTEEELAEAERLDHLFQSQDWIFQKGPLRRPGVKIHDGVQVHEVDHKAPGGLIRLTARTRTDGETIILDSVWISGDFTVIPKEGVAQLEQALAGVPIDQDIIAGRISRLLGPGQVQCPGLELQDWVAAITKIGRPG